MKKWFLRILAMIPLWETKIRDGRARCPFLDQSIFDVTEKRVWFFGWYSVITKIEYKPEVKFYYFGSDKNDQAR